MSSSDDTPAATAPEIPTDKEALERDIEQTRNELADTVEALAHKADVKAQVKEKGAELKEHAQEVAGSAKQRSAELAGQARHKASELAGQAKDKTAELAGQAKDKTAELAGRVKGSPDDDLVVAGAGPEGAAPRSPVLDQPSWSHPAQRPVNQQVIAVAAAGAVALLVWIVRRRRNG